MSGTDKNTRAVIRRILSDIRVELGDEFDRNFERQAFFSDAWARRKSPTRPGGTILVDTGTLRRSVKSRTTDDSITFYTDLPYAAIHNDGGEIVVTEKMKRFSGTSITRLPEVSVGRRTANAGTTSGRASFPQRPISGVLWP